MRRCELFDDWPTLTRLTGGRSFEIERVKLTDADVRIEGHFDLPPMARLAAGDQVFVAAFVRAHGSIKQMEKYFRVSDPTVKNRLNRIEALLPFIEIEAPDQPASTTSDLLTELERGELSVADILSQLKKKPEGPS